MPRLDRSKMGKLAFASACLALVAACDGEKTRPSAAAPEPTIPVSDPDVPVVPRNDPTPIYSVDSVTLEKSEGTNIRLIVRAHGTVNTGGWAKGELRQIQTLVPEQGVRTYTFFATPPRPEVVVTQALAPIEAETTLDPLPQDVKRIRIVAATNELVQALP